MRVINEKTKEALVFVRTSFKIYEDNLQLWPNLSPTARRTATARFAPPKPPKPPPPPLWPPPKPPLPPFLGPLLWKTRRELLRKSKYSTSVKKTI